MKKLSKILIIFLALTLCLISVKNSFAGIGGGNLITWPESDSSNLDSFVDEFSSIFYIFDLRERETFIQLTYPDAVSSGLPAIAHIQIFDVANNCNENNFFDAYTINDTHVYNMRDIQTNDGNPSGVVLPDGAYGIVAVTMYAVEGGIPAEVAGHFGNLRILDNNGYEYRTNAQGAWESDGGDEEINNQIFYSFNFNQQSGVSLSDVVGITLWPVEFEQFNIEWVALPVQGTFSPFDVDIYDLNEVPFSCRDIIFSCVDEDNPLLEELLAIAGTANVASFEYGINNAIPHSKGGELLCPGNNIGEGTVLLRPEAYPDTEAFADIVVSIDPVNEPVFFGFVGLNNGNGRGSMDSLWVSSIFTVVE